MVYEEGVARLPIALTSRKLRTNRTSSANDTLAQALFRIASILLRLGIDAPGAERLLRKAYVHAAAQTARSSKGRTTQSRIASLAGVSRLEVRTILAQKGRTKSSRDTRLGHVVAGWRSDPLFVDGRGRPRTLASRGGKGTFEHLARKYGRDVTARALSEELQRQKLVAIDRDRLTLRTDERAVSGDAIAAQADLRFLASQLADIDFQKGRRSFVIRREVVFTNDKKQKSMIKNIAIARLETVLNSLVEMSTANDKNQKHRPGGRILITTSIATDSEEAKS